MDAYIARQPILTRDKNIYGYELLFRNEANDKTFISGDADQASSRVMMESFFSTGPKSVTGGKRAFINFTERLILEHTATLFPKEHLVVELLEDVEPTPEVIEACRALHKEGYTLALDDFIYRPEFDILIELSRIIKFDFLKSSIQEIAETLKNVNFKGKWLLAEKIETNEMFSISRGMGFSLFQGYFFNKPVTMTTRMLSPLKINYVKLMREVSAEDDMDFQSVAKTIRDDVALSYKLLKLVNSAYYGVRSEVTDIYRAVSMIGTIELKKWVFMIALVGLCSDKPDEIVKMSMIRGRFLEVLNVKYSWVKSDEIAFQTGLFSMLDVLMDVQIQYALEGMHLAREVFEALVNKEGALYEPLELAVSMERGEWDDTDAIAEALKADPGLISDAYLDAVKWCESLEF